MEWYEPIRCKVGNNVDFTTALDLVANYRTEDNKYEVPVNVNRKYDIDGNFVEVVDMTKAIMLIQNTM